MFILYPRDWREDTFSNVRFTMDLNHEVQEGVQLCGESVQVPDKTFQKLILTAYDIILGKQDDSSIGDLVKSGTFKQAYYGVVTLILEAVKVNSSVNDLSSYLEECKWDSERIQFFNNAFTKNFPHIQALLSSSRKVFPHIVDIDWRLDYYVKNKHLDKVNKPTYLISLKTEESDKNGYNDIQFSCSLEQLQDLVGKLKDACKSLEKACQM